MSTHSEPRRWTLSVEGIQPGAVGPITRVSVREDKATSADVEAVAKLLAATENGKDPVGDHDPLWAECNDEEKAEWRADAAEFLARIFKEGEGR